MLPRGPLALSRRFAFGLFSVSRSRGSSPTVSCNAFSGRHALRPSRKPPSLILECRTAAQNKSRPDARRVQTRRSKAHLAPSRVGDTTQSRPSTLPTNVRPAGLSRRRTDRRPRGRWTTRCSMTCIARLSVAQEALGQARGLLSRFFQTVPVPCILGAGACAFRTSPVNGSGHTEPHPIQKLGWSTDRDEVQPAAAMARATELGSSMLIKQVSGKR